MKTLVGFATLTMLILSAAVMGQGYPALSENSYGYYGSGARAFAMGDAFAGLADDITSGTWNPAGVWVLEGPELAASYLIYVPKGEFTDSWGIGSTMASLDVKSLSDFSFATPMRIKNHPWVFNFNYVRNNEYTVEADIFTGNNPALNPDVFTEESGYLRTFNFGLSTRIYKQLSFGFTINIYNGRRIREQIGQAMWTNVYSEIPPISTELFQTVTVIDSIASDGLNFTLGLMHKTRRFNVGLVAHTPFKMRYDADQTQITVTTEEGLILTDFSNTIYVDDQITKQEIPLSLTLGTAFFPKENLSLTLDFNYQNYGSTNWFYRTESFFSAAGDRTEIFGELPIDWNNTASVGTGVEYLLTTGLGRIPIRAGFRYNQLPQSKTFDFVHTEIIEPDDENDDWHKTNEFNTVQTASERQSEMSLSFGTGIHWSQVELDFGYRYRFGSELNISETTSWYLDENNDGAIDTDDEGVLQATQTAKDQKYEDKGHEIRFTFIGHF
ncbi:MAG: hypothetical protein GY841_11470 [FCB group bacterium]|nr:hypothetical protein [FCB group bacterium]